MLEYIRHLEELQIVSLIRENSGLYSFDTDFFFGGGGIENFKTWKGGVEIYQYSEQGPCKSMSFFQDIFIPPSAK
jgi:hypothetical protein